MRLRGSLPWQRVPRDELNSVLEVECVWMNIVVEWTDSFLNGQNTIDKYIY